MKKHLLHYCITACLIISAAFNSCFKDSGTKRYYYYTPVYATTQQARNNITSSTSQPIVNAGKICILGNYIFLNEKEKGIHIIDNSNPAQPANKWFINIPGNQDVAIKGNTLYADCYTDLMAIDISNPSSISLKNYLSNLFPDRRYINGYYMDSSKVITEWVKRDTVVNVNLVVGEGIWINDGFITDKVISTPLVFFSGGIGFSLSSSSGTSVNGSMSRLAIVQDYLYAVTNNSLHAININATNNPLLTSTTKLNTSIETVYPFIDKLFIGSQTGMLVYDVSAPSIPNYISTFSHARVCDPVITDGINAYITLHSGSSCSGISNELDVVNVKNLLSPSLIKIYQLTHPNGLSKEGNTLIICDDNAGVKFYNASDPSNLQLLSTMQVNSAYDVIAINGVAIVSAKDGIYEFDYSNTNSIKSISKLNY